MKRIVVKIGSRVLATKDGFLDRKTVSRLVREIVKVKKEKGVEVIIVTSGAVSVGKSAKSAREAKIKTGFPDYDSRLLEEQIFAAVGQPKLMALYIEEFEKYKLDCAQILATRSDFAARRSYLSLRTVTENLLGAGVVPIFNENDVLSPEELDFSDNDQLALMVAAMTVSDKLIILSTVDGLFDGPPNGKKSKIIEVAGNIPDLMDLVDDSQISGKGGMKSKLVTAETATSLGIDVHVGSGKKKGVIEMIAEGKRCGTLFPAKAKKPRALKNWLAAGAAGKGMIFVSTCLAEILRSKKTASVLFLGIERVDGSFSKKDIVDIVDEEGALLGRGMAKLGSAELRRKISRFKTMDNIERLNCKTSEMIAVHYDYLAFPR